MAYQEGYLPTEAELQNAIRISLAAADGSLWANSARDEYGGLSQQTEFGQEINTAARIISAYAMNGGDVSKIPQSLQYLATTDWANRIDAAGSGQWSDVLPALAVAGGGLAGVFGGAAAAGAGAGTEAAATYGAAGEFGAGATAYGSGTAAGTTLAGSPGLSGFTGGNAAYGLGEEAIGATGGMAGTGSIPAATGPVATGTALSRIIGGKGTTQDYLELAGQIGPSLISAYGSGKQADAYSDLANKYMAMGAPYRDELSRISADPNAFYTSPTATKATESVLQRLSSQYGNPAGNPYAQALTVDALYDQYGAERDRLAGYGGLTQYASAAPGAASQAIGAKGTVYGDLGYGVGSALNPPPKQMTLAELLRNARV